MTTATIDKLPLRELDVLIVGGGFAGVYAARALQKSTRGTSIRIGMISDENHMVFQPMLPEVVGGSLSPRHVVNPIRMLTKGVEVFRGKVQEIDLTAKTVILRAGAFTGEIRFTCKQLVLALGAQVDTSRIPGMAEHALLLQNVGDAMKLRAQIIARMEEANLEIQKQKRQKLLNFLVVGGGYSGVETAGQILDLLRSVCKYYSQVDSDDYSVSLVHSRDHLLPTLHEKLGAYTGEVLEKNGMKLWLGQRVKSVTAGQVTLDNGTQIQVNTVVCTVGNAPHALVRRCCEQASCEAVGGRVLVNRCLQVPAFPGVWAAGDCAAIPAENGEAFDPPNAQFAYRQGLQMGKNISAVLKGKAPAPFTFSSLGELAVVGHRKAVAQILGREFSGFIAWVMWRTIYLSKLPGIEKKVRVALEWTIELFFPRDITLLTPQYTSPLREMYLTAGDVLFHAGEPAFSFYMVKEGQMEIQDNTGKIIKRLRPGQHFGERALLADKTWRFNAVAAEDTHLVSLGAHVFDTLIYASGELGALLRGTAKAYETVEGVESLHANIPAERHHLHAGDVMQRELHSLSEDMPAVDAMHYFQRHRHTLYPVVNREGQLVSALRRSAFYDWIKAHQLLDSDTITLAPCSPYITVPVDLKVPQILEKLIREGQTRAFVVEDSKLRGVLTMMDLIGPQGNLSRGDDDA
ncbi:FAD-dependent oxidoreductase [Kiritimatiellaeota bacterium B1221]|nr:FAD-dependent oxidoreductase [Kiritimatiellaeota bacterium B1221]